MIPNDRVHLCGFIVVEFILLAEPPSAAVLCFDALSELFFLVLPNSLALCLIFGFTMLSNYGLVNDILYGKVTLPKKYEDDFNPTMLIIWCETN